MKSKRTAEPEVESPWAVSILPGRELPPGLVPPMMEQPPPVQVTPAAAYAAVTQGPAPARYPAPQAAAPATYAPPPAYPAPAQFAPPAAAPATYPPPPSYPAAPQFAPPQPAAPQYAAPQFAPPQPAAPQYAPPQSAPAQSPPPQFGPPPPGPHPALGLQGAAGEHGSHGRRSPKEKTAPARTTVLIAVAVVVALAAGGYYAVPKLLGSKKAAVTPVAHHVVGTGATGGSATPTGAQLGKGFPLPAVLGTMPRLTDPASVATATKYLAGTGSSADFEDNASAALYRVSPTLSVGVVATVNDDLNKDLSNLDDSVAGILGASGIGHNAPALVTGSPVRAWIECSTFTNLGTGNTTPAPIPTTTCAYVSAAVIAEIIVPSPSGADQTTVATSVARLLH